MKKNKNKKSVAEKMGMSSKTPAKVRKLKNFRVATGDVVDEPVLDKFVDEDTKLDADEVRVAHPTDWDIRDEVSQMDSFRDYLQESRGNGINYGDY